MRGGAKAGSSVGSCNLKELHLGRIPQRFCGLNPIELLMLEYASAAGVACNICCAAACLFTLLLDLWLSRGGHSDDVFCPTAASRSHEKRSIVLRVARKAVHRVEISGVGASSWVCSDQQVWVTLLVVT